jgi:hypothetical protein|tara:strand:- start:186 stop:656 length:471 start_codon:yes stop_codon:yes gene_type:complete
MKKSNFKYHIRLKMTEELPKTDISGVIKVLKNTIANIFQPLEDGTAVIYHMGDEAMNSHIYDFRLNRGVTEEEAEVILELITDWTDEDFIMEVTTSKNYDIPEGETEVNLTAMKHNRWISNKVSEGWRYGLEFDKTTLTDPRLRPYHELTEKLKNI